MLAPGDLLVVIDPGSVTGVHAPSELHHEAAYLHVPHGMHGAPKPRAKRVPWSPARSDQAPPTATAALTEFLLPASTRTEECAPATEMGL